MVKKTTYIVLTSILFLVGIYFWSQNLGADPQIHFKGISKGITTDPAHYVYHARNKILFNEFDIFNDPQWSVFKHSINSYTSYAIFSITNVSYANTNIVGIILSITGLFFFLAGLYDKKRLYHLLLFTILYLSNFILFTYGRVPFLENALIFYFSIAYFIHTKWPDKTWSLILTGVIVSLATLTGKVFGLLLLPALVFSVYFSENKKKNLSISYIVISTIVSFAICAFLIYGSDFKYFLGLVSEQGGKLRGFPNGLRSPWAFVSHLLNFGAGNRLFYINFDLLLYLSFAVLFIAIKLRHGTSFSNLPTSIRFPLLLLGFSILVLSPINYSPLRYSLFLIPFILALFIKSLPFITEEYQVKNNNRYPLLLYLSIFWFSLVDFLIFIFFQNQFTIEILCWGTLPVAILLTYLFDRFFNTKVMLYKKTLYSLICGLLIFGITLNFFRFTDNYNTLNKYTIQEASIDLGMILGNEAVLLGSYAPVLILNNNLRSYIYQFSITGKVADFSNQYNVTHIVLSKPEYDIAVKMYPKLKNCFPIVTYWLRNVEVSVYYIGDLYQNSQTALYEPSYFEKAVKYEVNGFSDSAYIAIEQFNKNHTNSKSAQLLQAQLLLKANQFESSIQILNMLVSKYSTDSYLIIQCARAIQYIGLLINDKTLNELSQTYYQMAVKLNPECSQIAIQIFNNTQNMFQNR